MTWSRNTRLCIISLTLVSFSLNGLPFLLKPFSKASWAFTFIRNIWSLCVTSISWRTYLSCVVLKGYLLWRALPILISPSFESLWRVHLFHLSISCFGFIFCFFLLICSWFIKQSTFDMLILLCASNTLIIWLIRSKLMFGRFVLVYNSINFFSQVFDLRSDIKMSRFTLRKFWSILLWLRIIIPCLRFVLCCLLFFWVFLFWTSFFKYQRLWRSRRLSYWRTTITWLTSQSYLF